MKEYGVQSIDCLKELFNSSKSDKVKAVHLFKNLILLEKFRKVLEDNIFVPCNCLISGEKAILEKIDTNDLFSEIFGYLKLNKGKIRVPVEDVMLEDSDSMKYIDAYSWWKKYG